MEQTTRELLIQFFQGQMDFVYFVYGFSFLCLGGVCVSLRRLSTIPLRWQLLGAFGVIHGLGEWVHLLEFGHPFAISWTMTMFHLVSFLALLEFGRTSPLGRSLGITRRLVYPPLLAVVLVGAYFGPGTFAAASRYALCFPGALLSALAVRSITRKRSGTGLLRLASWSLFAYSILAGILVSAIPYFPGNILNTGTFLTRLGVPVQVARATAAAATAFFVWTHFVALRRVLIRRRDLPLSYNVPWVAPAVFVVLALGWYGTNEAGKERIKDYMIEVTEDAQGAATAYSALLARRTVTPAELELLGKSIIESDRIMTGIRLQLLTLTDDVGQRIELKIGSQEVPLPPGAFSRALEGGRLETQYRPGEPEDLATAIMPIRELGTGAVLGAVAIRTKAVELRTTIYHARLPMIFGTLLLASLLLLLFVSRERHLSSTARLASSETRYRTLVNGSSNAVALLRLDGSTEMLNPAGHAFFEVEPGSALPSPFFSVLTPEARGTWNTSFQDALDGKRSTRTIKFTCRNGNHRYFSTTMTPVRNSRGKISQIVMIATDITELRQTTYSLMRASALHRATIESTEEGIIVLDQNETILDYNQQFLKFVGATELDKTPGKARKTAELLLSRLKNPTEFLEVIKATEEGKLAPTVNLYFKDGRVIEHITNPLLLEGVEGRVFILRDITSRLAAEQQRADMQKQVFLAAKLASIGELAAGVAHEVNNPLAILKGQVSIMREDMQQVMPPPPYLPTLDKLDRAINRIATIVNGLRTYARSDTEVVAPIDIHKTLGDTLSLIEHIYNKGGITIETRLSATHTMVAGNTGKLQQVFMNLLANARDALEGRSSEKRIRLETDNLGQSLLIRITDNGSGIPQENLEKIFDAFFTTKPPGKGTGLGLSITHSIVQTHNGTITVSSQPGVGTTFTITLPLSNENAQTPAAAA